jgi:acetoin:2,6-dichlorophenolindophenol oxidoreductase subunit alpha
MRSVPTLADWKEMYGALWRIRFFEGHVQRLAAAGEIPGFPHLSTGQEAVAVGVCAHLSPEDVLFTSHRGHGHVLAKGSDLEATFAEILGRQSGLCRGRGGSMHLVDAARGVLGATGVVAGNLALAAGAAWAAQAQGKPHISVVFFGDGATGAGAFHETLNLAALWRLPVLFVCENNGYAEFTSREEHSNVNHVSSFAAPYAIATKTIDGNDLPTVFAWAGNAIEAVRRGEGPYLLECMTFRMAGHYVGDAQQYRASQALSARARRAGGRARRDRRAHQTRGAAGSGARARRAAARSGCRARVRVPLRVALRDTRLKSRAAHIHRDPAPRAR